MKKRGFGVGKVNGVGGKLEEGETVTQGAVRETQEEINVTIAETDLKKVADIKFTFVDENKAIKEEYNTHVFLADKFEGEPIETEEMKPEWYKISEAPYEKMWEDDKSWLPLVLSGRTLNAHFEFNPSNKIQEFSIKYTN